MPLAPPVTTHLKPGNRMATLLLRVTRSVNAAEAVIANPQSGHATRLTAVNRAQQ